MNPNTEVDDNFLVFGIDKGHVIFVRLDLPNYIYARFSVHRQSIEHIAQIRHQKIFITMCTELNLHIWSFVDNKVQKHRSFELQRSLGHIKVIKDNILLIH